MTFNLHFLDVGQGDATIVELPGYFGLIDFARASAAKTVVSAAVREQLNRGNIFLFAAATHFDDDHVGGLPSILDIQEPQYFLLPAVGLELIEEWARSIVPELSVLASIQRLFNSTARRIKCDAGVSVPFLSVVPDLECVVLSPDCHVEDELRSLLNGNKPDSSLMRKLIAMRNRASLALYFSYKGSSAVLLAEMHGDQYPNIWEIICQFLRGKYREPCVVKLAHHGARENNPEELFTYFGRKGVLMSVSAGSQYGHPDVEVLAQVEQTGAIPACSNLGQGCDRLIPLVSRPPDLAAWKLTQTGLNKTVPGKPKCYGAIRVELASRGTSQVAFQTVQMRCPFGGLSTASARLPIR